jgi:MFS family permease
MWCLSNPAQSRYFVRMLVAAGLCIVFSALAAVGFKFGHLTGPLAWLVATVAALPIVGALVGTGAYLREETDEFQRNVLIQSLLGGIGGTLAAATIWGYLEDFVQAPHLRLIFLYPMFWLFVVLSMPLVLRRYR